MQETFRMEDLCQVLIELEQKGQKHYAALAELSEDKAIKTLFETLAGEEKHHEALYRLLRDEWVHYETSESSEEYMSYVRALIDTTFETLREDQVITDIKVGLRLALILEKDTIMLLSELRHIMPDHTSEKIEKIIAEERKHMETIVRLVK